MLSYAQEQMWFLHRAAPSTAYTVPAGFDITGPLDVRALRDALQALVDRHEILRTEYGETGGFPTARVHPPTPVACPVVELRSGEPGLLDALRAECARPLALDGPLRMHATLYRLKAGHHVLLLMFHHIVIDGPSVWLLVNEMCRHYRSGGGNVEDTPPPQFSDQAKAERGSHGGATASLDYWRERLAGLDDVELPGDRPRPAVSGAHRGELLRRDLPPGLMDDVAALATGEQVSPFMVILAALTWTLSRTTGSTDIPVGVSTSSRTSAESFGTVGLFVNMLAFRSRIDPDLTFGEFLRQTRGDLLADLEHRQVPFSRVVEAVRPSRHLGTNPLFQIALGYERGEPDQALAPGVVLRPRDARDTATGHAKFEIDILVSSGGKESFLYVEYAADLFDRWRIECLLDHFEHVLTAAVREPQTPLRDIQLFDSAARDKLIGCLTGPKRPTPSATLHELFARQARDTPSRIAAECPDGAVMYADLNARAETVAGRLRSAGVEPGDRVAVRSQRGVAMLAALLGVLKAGAVYLPVDAAVPRHRVDRQFSDSGVRVLVDGANVRTLDASGAGRPPARDRRPLAYVLYTSGSTGHPKGVLVSHAAAVDFITQWGDRFGIGDGSRVLQFSNLTFDVSVLEIFAALCRGGTVCMPPADTVRAPDELHAYLRDARIDVAAVPPTVADLMPARPGLPLRVLSIGGEAYPAAVAARWCVPGREVLNSYGPTEATVIVAAHTCSPDQADPVPFGRPRANTYAYVVDAFGGLAPAGVPGELWIGGVSVAEGYENAPEATREAFLPDPFIPGRGTVYRTGDRCVVGLDGELTFQGRLDDQVKVRGFRVELGEVEAALTSHRDVRQAVAHVVGTGADARLAAWVVPAPGGCDTTHVRRWISEILPAYMRPSTVDVIESIPLTRHGKVDRPALPEVRAYSGVSRTQPRTPGERDVAEAFSSTLGVRSVGVQDDFFDLGGTSLQIIRLLAELRRLRGISLPVGDVYAAPTVEALAERMAGAPRDVLPAQLSALTGNTRPGQGAEPLFLIHPSGGSALCYAPLAQQIGLGLQCWGVAAEALHGGPLPGSVAAMAEQYAAMIAQVCPGRPVHVGGWSLGGMIAHAVAHRLRHRWDHDVGGLVLIDTVLPDGMPPTSEQLTDSFRAEVTLTLGGRTDPRNPRETPELRRRLELYTAIVHAAYRHRPGPVDAPALRVSAAETGTPSDSWDGLLTGSVAQEVLPGDHFGLIKGPAVGSLAAVITSFLTRPPTRTG